jgi:hypothetical protein
MDEQRCYEERIAGADLPRVQQAPQPQQRFSILSNATNTLRHTIAKTEPRARCSQRTSLADAPIACFLYDKPLVVVER